MEIGPHPEPPPRPPTDAERDADAERLTDAAGDGRLILPTPASAPAPRTPTARRAGKFAVTRRSTVLPDDVRI